MDDSPDILMSTLIGFGVLIPKHVSSIAQFSSEDLVSISAQLLNLIDHSASFCVELPHSLPERFRICTDIALSLKNLGYIGEMSYYKFLYPSEDDSYRLVRFLVERLSEKNEGIKASPAGDMASRPKSEINHGDISNERMVTDGTDETFDMHIQKVEAVLKDLTMSSDISRSSDSKSKNTSANYSPNVDPFSRETDDLVINEPSGYEDNKELVENTVSEDPSEISYKTVELQRQQNLLLEELESGSSELCSLDSELELVKVAAKRLLEDKHPSASYLEQLNQQLLAKRCNMMDINKQWDDARLTLETKKLRLLDQLYAEEPEAQEKIQKLRNTELELQSLSSEIQKREDERCNLYNELERRPKAAPRKSYIHGIKEITKNSRKLDTDIQRISGEIRGIQLESNSIQERLHRTYAVVDEMVTREVKKDPAVRQVYKLLTSIHGTFEQISEKIILTDRLRREATDYEKKLRAITARSMSLEKLQADLDAIRRERKA